MIMTILSTVKKTKVVEEMHRAFVGELEAGRGKFCEDFRFGKESFSSGAGYREAISDHVPIMMTIELK